MEKKEKNIHAEAFFQSRGRRYFEVLLVTILSVVVLAGGGYLLDKLFKTDPALLIVGLLLSFFAAQIIIYKRMRKYARMVNEKIKNG